MALNLVDEIQAPNAAIRDRVYEGFAERYAYPDQIPDPADPSLTIPNPQSKKDFMREALLTIIRETTEASERETAGDVARKVASDKAKLDIKPT